MARQPKRKTTPKTRARPRVASAGKRERPGQRAAAPALPEELVVEKAEKSVAEEPEPDALLAGGDVDADEERAASASEEAVGGSGAMPDKDVVDDLGRAVGVELPPTAPIVTSEEVLRDRDARYWDLEWRARKREEKS
jgi:hypothetical protein